MTTSETAKEIYALMLFNKEMAVNAVELIIKYTCFNDGFWDDVILEIKKF